MWLLVPADSAVSQQTEMMRVLSNLTMAALARGHLITSPTAVS
jgi:hypothetical protein